MGTTHNLSLKALSSKMDVEVTALADCRPEFLEKAAEQWPDARLYKTGMELLEAETLDSVHICLPSYLHTEHAVAAMDRGINVFVEKPVCLTEEEAQKLLDVTKQSFFEGIKQAKAGNHLFDISAAIDDYVSGFGYGIVQDLVGHGIGTNLHEDPQIPNFRQKRHGIKLVPGMTLAIEPMVNMGTWKVKWLDDEWTVISEDHSLSAHYENTILITDGEPEILTLHM